MTVRPAVSSSAKYMAAASIKLTLNLYSQDVQTESYKRITLMPRDSLKPSIFSLRSLNSQCNAHLLCMLRKANQRRRARIAYHKINCQMYVSQHRLKRFIGSMQYRQSHFRWILWITILICIADFASRLLTDNLRLCSPMSVILSTWGSSELSSLIGLTWNWGGKPRPW